LHHVSHLPRIANVVASMSTEACSMWWTKYCELFRPLLTCLLICVHSFHFCYHPRCVQQIRQTRSLSQSHVGRYLWPGTLLDSKSRNQHCHVCIRNWNCFVRISQNCSWK